MMFVEDQPIAVTLPGGENTIWIRPKMDLGTRNWVLDELARIGGAQGPAQMAMKVGSYMTALALANIVKWDGPAFDGRACTPENIRKLDPDEPLVDAVLEEIGRRNPLGGSSAAEKKG